MDARKTGKTSKNNTKLGLLLVIKFAYKTFGR